MTHNDLTHWPLVITVAQGAPSLPETEAFIQDWNRWLARGEPFATLRVFVDAQALTQPPGSPQLVKQWLQEKNLDVRAQVKGMATVVPPSEYERLSKMNAEKLFGVPAATFSDLAASLEWMRKRVYVPRGLRLDVEGVTATVQALQTATA